MFGHHGHSNDFRPHHGGHGGWDTYGGPQALVEPGFRGFLISTLPGKEEFAVDDTILLLRQAAIKMYGAVKITSKKLASNPRYLAIDFMDPANIKLWPTPEEEKDEEEEKEKEKSTTAEGVAAEEATEKETPEVKEEENKAAEESTEKNTETAEEPKEDNISSNAAEGEADSTEKKDENNKGKDEASDQDKKPGETGGEKPAPPAPKRKQYPIMRSIYKFKAFRTESRNVMFIQSNVPDPIALAEASMELLLERKRVYEDGACQLLPVLGVCPFDLEQLEVMSQQVLSPMFSLTEEPKTFSVMVLENLPGPSTENVLEIVRNTIWSVNPFTCQTSPLTEPDVLVQVDLVGSKLVLCCISKYMHYRYYSPNLLIKQGRGEPEEDDGTWLTPEERKQQEQIRLEREKQKEFERQRQEDFRKERERRKIQFEERRRLQIEERKKAKSKAAESKAAESKAAESKESKKSGHTAAEKHEGSSKNVDDTPEDTKEEKGSSPPSKKQKMEASEENQNGSSAPDEEAEKTESQAAEPEEGGAPSEDSQPAPATEEELNAEAEDQEEMDTSTSEAKDKGKQTRKRGRGPRGGRSRSKK